MHLNTGAKPTLFKARYVRRPLRRARRALSHRNSTKFRRPRRLMTVAHRPRRIRKVMRPLLQWYYNLNLLSAAASPRRFLRAAAPRRRHPSFRSARLLLPPLVSRASVFPARPNRLPSLPPSVAASSLLFFFYQPTSTRCVRQSCARRLRITSNNPVIFIRFHTQREYI